MRAWEINRQAALVEWAERVRACRSSGLSVTAWCEEEGIERKTYYWWEQEVLKLAGENRTQGQEVEFAQLAPAAQVETKKAQRRRSASEWGEQRWKCILELIWRQ